MSFLSAADPAGLSPSDLVDAVITAERLLAHVHAVQVRLMAELGRPQRCGDITGLVEVLVERAGAGRGPDGVVDADLVAQVTADRSVGVAATELAAVLDWSPTTARIRIEQAMRLESALPATLAALGQGRVDVGRARMIVDRTAVLSAELCAEVEGRVLGWVKGRSKARLESLVDREVILADPAAAENRRVKAVKDRCVMHRPDKDGMGVITALLPAEAAVMVFTLVDLIADANKGLDARTVDQRRADAITDIADELLTFGFVDLDGLIARADHATAGGGENPAAPSDDAPDAAAVGAAEQAAPTNPAPADTAPQDAAPHSALPQDAAPDNAVPQDAVPGSAVPDSAVPDSAVPDSAVPKDAAPESARPDSAIPADEAPDNATPEDAAPDNATPADAAPDNATPADAAPDNATPADAAPDNATPADAAPDNATPADAAPDNATPADAAPDNATPADAAPDNATPADAAPDNATPADEAPDNATPEDAAPDNATPVDAAPESAIPAVPDSAVPASAVLVDAALDSAVPASAVREDAVSGTAVRVGAPTAAAPSTGPVAAVTPGPSAGAVAAGNRATEAAGMADRAARLARAMSRHGRRTHLSVTGAWTTVTGLDDLPGQLDGHGAITAPLLRAIAKSWGTLTAVGVDPVTGTASAIGALTYRPGRHLSDQVIIVSGTCRLAGCRMPAWRCDIDHIAPFNHHQPTAGGQTTLCNTLPYCRFHHLLKHHTDWTPHLQADLSVIWTTNTGHQATSHPREFTLPGEWLRPRNGRTNPHLPAPDPDAHPHPPLPDPAACGPVIIGPTVAGPTIPVIPAGTHYTEPHTELEDPDTIPHPGSVEINTYRMLRQHTREHSQRRLAVLRNLLDPMEQRKRDYIAGQHVSVDGTKWHGADFDTSTNELAALTRNGQIAAQLHQLGRPATAQQPTPHTLSGDAHQPPPTTDEPPF